jgi:zinc and cadmium transporter
LFERVLHWHHCADEFHPHLHEHDHARKGLIALNLFGDSLHNFIDGFLVAGAFMLDFGTGVTVTIAVILHEIPQEISDFGILLYGGLSRARALAYNFLTALTAVLGAVIFYLFGTSFAMAIPVMGAIAAGNFVYLAIADLIPELYNEKNRTKIFIHTLWLLVGVALIYAVTVFVPHGH